MSSAFATGAQRGVEQTAKLLKDPSYYETLRERRKREHQRFEQYQNAQQQERLERRLAPTAQQIEQEEIRLNEGIAEREADIQRYKERLAYLATLKNRPKHIRITDGKK
jgi:FMN phosphatase YigB (HAD superfamily)